MIIPDDKRRIATIIASRRKANGEKIGQAPLKAEVVKDEQGEIDGRHIAAQEAMMAIHEKSPEKFMQSMANFMDLHSSAPKPDVE
jgi:hypothetical protein